MDAFAAFDGILCIALSKAHARIAHVRRMAARLKIPIEFYFVTPSPRSGLIGCFASHIGALSLALDRGLENVLIFEDDFVPSPSYSPAVIAAVGRFCRRDATWECVKLGFGLEDMPSVVGAVRYMAAGRGAELLVGPELSVGPGGAYTVRYTGLLAHALVVSRRGMEKLVRAGEAELARPDREIQHYDMWMRSVLSPRESHCVVPVQFDQAWDFPTTNSLPPGMKDGLFESVLRRFQWLNAVTLLTYRATFLHPMREGIAIAAAIAVAAAICISLFSYV